MLFTVSEAGAESKKWSTCCSNKLWSSQEATISRSPHERHPLSLPEGTPQTAPTHPFELRGLVFYVSLTCVSSNVSLKQPGSGESLATDLADTRQGVGPNVHLKGTQAHIFLVTVFAAERLPRLGITMQLLMFGQPRESRIGLIA